MQSNQIKSNQVVMIELICHKFFILSTFVLVSNKNEWSISGIRNCNVFHCARKYFRWKHFSVNKLCVLPCACSLDCDTFTILLPSMHFANDKYLIYILRERKKGQPTSKYKHVKTKVRAYACTVGFICEFCQQNAPQLLLTTGKIQSKQWKYEILIL